MTDFDADRTQTGTLSWVLQLQHYVRPSGSSLLPSAAILERKRLSDAVLENPTSSEEWWAFLQHEDALSSSSLTTMHQTHEQPPTPLPPSSSGGISLRHLYHRATELVQRCKGRPSAAYVNIWLGYAKHQW